MKKIFLIVIIILIAIALIYSIINCPFCRDNKKTMAGENITLVTEDNIKIAGYYLASSGDKGVILAHQLGRDKNSWGDLPAKLNQVGWSVLAIDLRGHGESDLSYNNFSDADFQKMIYDIAAARNYLAKQGKTEIETIGSSIGANLAIMAVSQNSADKGVALSPGLNFRGLMPEAAAKQIASNGSVRILLVSAQDDKYSDESVGLLAAILGSTAQVISYSSGGHGISLLTNQPDLVDQVINFLK